ncbi:MAG: DUF721 domain-containing protein [Mailhella sp.]|nr:DUF721 domain-containing protein [Mailhella sp.]
MNEKKYHKRFAGHDLNRRRNHTAHIGSDVSGWLAAHGMKPQQTLLGQLWRNWEIVMGPEIAPLARPLGHRHGILLIGGDDSYVLQELSYAAPEILERANAFMDEEFFQKVELHLLMGKDSLQRVDITQAPKLPPPPKPFRLGKAQLPQDSPVAAAYAAYVKMFEGEE